jgi:hypothetical protein
MLVSKFYDLYGKTRVSQNFCCTATFFFSIPSIVQIADSLSAKAQSFNLNPHKHPMYLVAIAWMYVVVMMSVAEATAPNGTVLGAIITFVFYGVLPVVILMYLMGTPMRRKAIRAKEQAELELLRAPAASMETPSEALSQPDAGSKAPADPVTPVGKEV